MTGTPPPEQAPAGGTGGADTSTFVPDPNEPPEALDRYQEARRLVAERKWDEAKEMLAEATEEFPESRHLHQQYAELLWHLSEGTDQDLLKQSGQEAVRAMELASSAGRVDYRLTDLVAKTLGRTGDKATLDRLFSRALAQDPSAVVHLDYAKGLALLEDPRAGEMLEKTAKLDPDGDAAVSYGEWLLDQGRDSEALEALPTSSPLYYVHFLRGVALERLGRAQEARAEYERFKVYSSTYPAPARFRIPGSRLQAESGIRFAEPDQTGR
jgi:tetratricopeptide (TPR) repeat protein